VGCLPEPLGGTFFVVPPCIPLASASLVVLSLVALPARATTFDERTIEELAAASDLVVAGRVATVEVYPHGPAGQHGIHTRALVHVRETLRGAPQQLVEVWVHGGRLGDRMRVVPGQANLREGEELVLFLFGAGGALWPTGMGRGKWIIGGNAGNPSVQPAVRDQLQLGAQAPITLAGLRAIVARTNDSRSLEALP
jgi:hypothetical protein